MKSLSLSHRLMILAVLVAPLAGCGAEGTTVDKAPTAPPITKENGKDLAKDINAGGAGMKPPGVKSAPTPK